MMFQNLMIALAVKALQSALCQMFGFCINQDDCPDGVCDEALVALDSLDDDSPSTAMSPDKTQALNFEIDWKQLQPLVQATVALIAALKLFLGLGPKVG